MGYWQPAIAQNAYKLGEDALQREDYTQALKHFNNHLQNTSNQETGKTLTRLGYTYSQLGRYAEAMHAYQNALRLMTSRQTETITTQALLGLGYIAYRQGKFDNAIQLYTKVVEQGGTGLAEAHHNLGRIYAGRGNIEKAIAAQQQAITLDTDFSDAYYHLGTLYGRKQKWHKAIDAYQKSVTLEPLKPNAHYQLARCYRQTGDTIQAEKALHRFRALKKADADIQKHSEAAFNANTANKATALIKLAYTYLKYQRYEAATQTFERAKQHNISDIDSAQVSASLGRIALEQGNTKQAITHYKQAIQIGLQQPETYHYLGIAYMQNKDGENAIKQFQKALSLNSDLQESHLLLGTLYATKRKFTTAEIHYQRAIALAPKMAAAYHGLAYLYGQHNQKLEKATELARKAARLSPQSATYHNTLSWLCYKVGKYDEAETAILKAIELSPDNTVYKEGLKEIQRQKK